MPESIRDENTGVTLHINDDGSINIGNESGQVSSVNPLPVDATINVGTVSIGNVGIKDGNSGIIADVENIGSYNALLVKEINDYQKTPYHVYSSSSIAAGATLTVSSYTVSTANQFVWKGVLLSADELCEFYVTIDGTRKGVWRNSGSERGKQLIFAEAIIVTAGALVEVKAKNLSNKTKTFHATIQGYERVS